MMYARSPRPKAREPDCEPAEQDKGRTPGRPRAGTHRARQTRERRAQSRCTTEGAFVIDRLPAGRFVWMSPFAR